MNERQQRFIDLLRQIFEIDKSDLDFGIYRILNIRKKEIEDFFVDKLPEQISNTLAPFANDGKEEIRQKMTAIEQQCGGAEMLAQLPDTMPMKAEYNNLKTQLQQGTDIAALENDVYSALYTFFNSYYDEGDFISKRRYKDGKYAIPYEGEEVKLYWANQDQYYIKTSENFKDYTFKADSYTVHFRLVDATTEQNNNKEADDKKRKFMIFTEDEENYPGIKTFEQNEIKDKDGNVIERELIIRFIFDVPQDSKAKYDEINFNAIKQYLVSQSDAELITSLLRIVNETAKKADQITLIQKHLKGYVAKNTFDYFIHKDLGGFLTRELDFFIKNEVMHLDDIDTDNEKAVNTYLAKVRAIKRVGKTIIDFLAQLENFQKKLWLKKKFVVETNWCITLDRIDEKFYDEIRKNKAQVQEWIDMYAIDELVTDLEHTEPFTEVPNIIFLKQNQNLIVDTKHFPDEFKNKLIASIDDLDENTGGLMINSDNFHGLSLLQEKYRKRVNCVYGDPPYNAKSSEILYKNSFKHSSWLSMMNSRLQLASTLKTDKGAIVTAIDENEGFNVLKLLDGIFPDWNKTAVTVLHNPAGVQGDNFSYSHEYAVFLFENYKHVIGKVRKKEISTEPFRDWGPSGLRNPQGDTFYPIVVNLEGDKILSIGKACTSDFHPGSQNIVRDDCILVYPVGDDGIEKKWVFARNTVETILDELYPQVKNGIVQIMRDKSKGSYKTVWTDEKYYANIYGSKLLNNIMGAKKFDFPKSLYTVSDCVNAVNETQTGSSIVLDYFAGSGTTGHAVIDLNRNNPNSNRNYILIEMGSYFNTVTHPRVKKVVYAPDWKKGKPTSRDTGISHIMKYLRLESYEDALSNIKLKEQDGMRSLFGDEYLINYMLDLEAKDSLLNVKAFTTPFDYEMKITEKNECKEQRVDVCETFNYLIGLTVVRQGEIRYFNAVPARNPKYEDAVDLDKAQNGEFAFRQIEGTVPDADGNKKKVLIIWRNITEDLMKSNAALDAYFEKYRINPQDREYDIIYVNGDSNLENLRNDDESWKVVMTEMEFNNRMFEEA